MFRRRLLVPAVAVALVAVLAVDGAIAMTRDRGAEGRSASVALRDYQHDLRGLAGHVFAAVQPVQSVVDAALGGGYEAFVNVYASRDALSNVRPEGFLAAVRDDLDGLRPPPAETRNVRALRQSIDRIQAALAALTPRQSRKVDIAGWRREIRAGGQRLRSAERAWAAALGAALPGQHLPVPSPGETGTVDATDMSWVFAADRNCFISSGRLVPVRRAIRGGRTEALADSADLIHQLVATLRNLQVPPHATSDVHSAVIRKLPDLERFASLLRRLSHTLHDVTPQQARRAIVSLGRAILAMEPLGAGLSRLHSVGCLTFLGLATGHAFGSLTGPPVTVQA